MSVTVDIRNLHKTASFIGGPACTQAVMRIGEEVVLPQLLNNWQSSRGGDGTTLKPLSKGYQAYKYDKTGRSKPDMVMTGSMTQSMITMKTGRQSCVVTAASSQHPSDNGTNLDILRHNAFIRKNLMTVSKKMKDDAVKVLDQEVAKWCKGKQ